jgi:predicted dienelactone hydrolase
MTQHDRAPVGYRIVSLADPRRERPIILDLWYPAPDSAVEAPHDYGLGRGRVAPDAAVRAGRHPCVVLSHGAFGAARNYTWIADYLARAGYCVIGVSHHRESYVYGAETIEQAAAAQPWLRPPDCSAALDYLLADATFGPALDARRIGALGHSSGGSTVIALAGALYDPAAMQRYCASPAAAGDKGCDYARDAPPVRAPSSTDFRDARIKAVVALDPALGPGHSLQSLAAVHVPVHIVGAVDNDFLPFDQHAGRYARSMPRASSTYLTHGEGHFVFLDECSIPLEANGVSLSRDRPGVSRAAVHAQLQGIIRGFFDATLEHA